MSEGLIRGKKGGIAERKTVTGPQSYSSGTGFSVRSDLGRVDETQVTADGDGDGTNKSWDAAGSVPSDANNYVVVRVFSNDTGVSAPDETDLSGVDFKIDNARL